jgi:hypothetical protein
MSKAEAITKAGHYFSTAGETVKQHFVLFNLTPYNIARNHLGVNQLTPYSKANFMHLISGIV